MNESSAFLAGVFMVAMGCGIAAIWTVDVIRNPDVDRRAGFAAARDRSTGSLLLPYWLAEYATAALPIAGGLRLLLGWAVGGWTWLVAVALGALAYTSLNSLGWALADRSRSAYVIPMSVGLLGSVASIGLLVAGVVVSPTGW